MNAHTEATKLQPGVPGKAMNLAGSEYIIAPLNLRQLEELGDVIDGVNKLVTLRDVSRAALALAHASLSRNYPEITKAKVAEIVDVGNMRDVIETVLTTSGYGKTKPGE